MKKWSWKKICASLCVAALTILAAPSHALPGEYVITDLGTLGGAYSSAFGINNAGQVVGNSTFTSHSEMGSHVFLYNGGAMLDLGSLIPSPGEAHASGLAVNNAGQIAGVSDYYVTSAKPFRHAFLYSGGIMRDIGTLGGRESAAYAINNVGQVAGESRTTIIPDTNPNLDPAPIHAFLYGTGAMTDLGTLGGKNSFAYGVNNGGDVVGTSQIAGDTATRAFLYCRGKMVDIGTLGGTNSTAYGINDAQYIVGGSDLRGNRQSHAFFYNGITMKDLGTLGGSYSVAKAFNNAGQVVGASRINDAPYDPLNFDTYNHAFLYDKGKMHDLNALPEVRKSGWFLREATAINDIGQIVGIGYINGKTQHRAFLLTLRGRRTK